MLQFAQRIGKALLLPIAVLPAAALLLRLGQEDLLNIAFIEQAGSALFDNLDLLFAIGVAIGFSRDGHGTAGLAGVIGFLVLNDVTQAFDENIDMGVLGGIITGIVAGSLYNRFANIQLPDWLAFFGGKRFVPIITAATMVVLSAIFGVIWPPIQAMIYGLGEWIIGAGALGVGVYGFINRLLIPIGLHHVVNSLIWFVFGEYNGATGEIDRFFAGDPEAGFFLAGFFPVMMFGLPAACLAMILAAKRSRRKETIGILGSLAITSFATGITEPIEFSFMFLSPLLYVVHALLTASSMIVTYLLEIRLGFGFSAGAIDYLLNFNIGDRPLLLLLVGIGYGFLYFFVFYFLIRSLDLKTPGREDEDEETTEPDVDDQAHTGDKYQRQAHQFIQDLGGKENIRSLDNCATRLRLQVDDMSRVEENNLKKHGANGVMKMGQTSLQVIVGTQVEFVADAMKELMQNDGAGKGTAAPTSTAKDEHEDQPTAGAAGEVALSAEDIVAPMEGTLLPIDEVPDQAFAQKAMGDGFAIEPTTGQVVSPIDGEIVTVFPSKHAIGIKSNTGLEVLVHIGIDTVKLEGKGFNLKVNQGDQVRKGEPIMELDVEYLSKNVPSLVTPIVFTNLPEGTEVSLLQSGKVKRGDAHIIQLK